MYENVLKSRVDLLPGIGLRAEGDNCPFESIRIRAAYVQPGAESDRLLYAWRTAQLPGDLLQIRAADRPGGQLRACNHLGCRAAGQQIPI